MREILPPGAEAEYITVEDYLRIEELSEERHEYVAGVLFSMAGGTRRHNRIISNLVRQMLDPADATACEVYAGDVKLRVANDVIYYPDVFVACDSDERDPLIMSSACVIVEVQSPSTSVTDRTEKLIAYRAIPSLRAYLIIRQDAPLVIRHWRSAVTDPWNIELHSDGEIPIPCLDMHLPIDAIYRNLPRTDDAEE